MHTMNQSNPSSIRSDAINKAIEQLSYNGYIIAANSWPTVGTFESILGELYDKGKEHESKTTNNK